MNFTDFTMVIRNAIAYLLDNPVFWCSVVFCFCVAHHNLQNKNSEITKEKNKLEKEKKALEEDADIGKSFATTVRILKS